MSNQRCGKDIELDNALTRLMPAGILAAARQINELDDTKLGIREAAIFADSVKRVQQASGAARELARQLMSQVGLPYFEILKHTDGRPIWPQGVVGSLSHDEHVAVAALTFEAKWSGLGIDVEPNEPLADDLSHFIVHRLDQPGPLVLRQLFSIKEAVFKAVYPVDHIMLDFKDVVVDYQWGRAVTSYGRCVNCRSCANPSIFSIAWY